MHMGFNTPCNNYDIDGIQIQNVDEEKDLGIIVSKDLKWESSLVLQYVRTANRMLGMIKRNFVDRSEEIIILRLIQIFGWITFRVLLCSIESSP